MGTQLIRWSIKFWNTSLEFPSLGTSSAATWVIQNGVMCSVLCVRSGVKNRELCLQYRGDFVWSLLGNYRRKCPFASVIFSQQGRLHCGI